MSLWVFQLAAPPVVAAVDSVTRHVAQNLGLFGPGGSGNMLNTDLALALVRPGDIFGWLALLALTFGLAFYGAEVFAGAMRGGARMVLTDELPFIGAIVALGIWPWAWGYAPLLATLLAVFSMIGALVATLRGRSREACKCYTPFAVALVAGWITVASFAAFAGFSSTELTLPVDIGATLIVIAIVVTAWRVQTTLVDNIGYILGVMAALLALSVVLAGSNIIAAGAAVFGIGLLSAVLVRAAT